jgi:hypothetical protein
VLIALSPYHLSTREPAAMASLLLASRVITMMPVPSSGTSHEDLWSAVDRSPAYLRFMDSWKWSIDLWRSGVIASTFMGQDAADDMAAVCEKIDRDQNYLPLRPILRRTLFDDDRNYLGALATDLLKGGPDPGISVPLAAALDRFASRHGMPVARSAPVSIAQQAETRLGRRLIATALPILTQAEGERIARARDILAAPLAELRRVLDTLVKECIASDPTWSPGSLLAAELNSAAADYNEAFNQNREELLRCHKDEIRSIEGTVTLSLVLFPGDAVLRSSLAALKAASGISPRSSRAAATTAAPATRSLALSDPADARPILSLVVRAMGSR